MKQEPATIRSWGTLNRRAARFVALTLLTAPFLTACNTPPPTHKPKLPDLYGVIYPQAERRLNATEHVDSISVSMNDGALTKVTQELAYVCTVELDGSNEGGVHVTLVLDLHNCPGGTPRPDASDATEAALTKRLAGLRVLDALAPADPDAALDTEQAALDGTYGDVPDLLLPSMDNGEVFEALDIQGHVGEYCIIDTGPHQYGNDRYGYICRVGEDLYGRLVFRTVPHVDPVYNRSAYGLQAWLCCETREDTLAPED